MKPWQERKVGQGYQNVLMVIYQLNNYRVNIYDDFFELIPLWKIADDNVFSQVSWINEIKFKVDIL